MRDLGLLPGGGRPTHAVVSPAGPAASEAIESSGNAHVAGEEEERRAEDALPAAAAPVPVSDAGGGGGGGGSGGSGGGTVSERLDDADD